jgi:hypothetical protein
MLAHAQIMYKSWRSIFLLFWPGKVRSSWLLPDLAGVLLLKMLPPSEWLQLAGQLLCALPHCSVLFELARHAGMSQNIGDDKISAPTKISLIFAKLQQSISLSAHRRPIKKW